MTNSQKSINTKGSTGCVGLSELCRQLHWVFRAFRAVLTIALAVRAFLAVKTIALGVWGFPKLCKQQH